MLENEIFKLEEQICDFDEELRQSPDIPEESREKILSTVGLAKLLVAEKLMQFRGLCDKNINVKKEEDPFVPTNGDLAGFWDMVHIQVVWVHNKFDDLKKLKSQGWKEEIKVEVKPKAKKPMNKNVNKPIKPKEKSEAAKARDEARKKMLEAKKRAMKQNGMPVPAPKPEHLMSPPLLPLPSDGTRSPADSCRTGSTMSPCPPLTIQEEMLEEEPVTENNTNTMNGLPPCSSMKELSLGTEEEGEAEAAKQNKEEREEVTNSPTSHINGTAHHQKEEPQQNYQMSHNYQELLKILGIKY